ncbi:MAG: type II toxin-antitoxin system VapC family toxin [Nostoc sp.]|uniref:type II toxin-antitoxin system VapC family toxin n=1 Tax=Nostoc sp. TaxID=1180 RepID=UPI002FF87D7B
MSRLTPMNGKYLLDTNIIIALFADEPAVKNHLSQTEQVFIPSIAVGELYYGARKSRRSKENLERIEEFIANSTVLGCDVETARHYGNVKNNLRLKGRALPENDIWIAAVTL